MPRTRSTAIAGLRERTESESGPATPQLGTQPGGYAFERWFYDLAIYFELDSRPGYTADGRQIDGAITIEGTTFLLETKFTKEPVGSPEIDTFMAKIESKVDNTMGLFVSISGFNDGAKQAASKQRTPMLLLDHSHIFNLHPAGNDDAASGCWAHKKARISDWFFLSWGFRALTTD